MNALLVFVGAGVGGVLRHAVNQLAARALGPAFPWGILAVNVAGSLVMGLVVGWLAARADQPWSGPARLLLATGLCGGFTTFSAFSLDAVLLWERGEMGLAAAYTFGSAAGSIAALGLGLGLVRALTP